MSILEKTNPRVDRTRDLWYNNEIKTNHMKLSHTKKYEGKFEKYSDDQISLFEKRLDEKRGKKISHRFEYAPGEKAGYFDEITWNIYGTLVDHYSKNGLKGRSNWIQAHRHAVAIAKELEKIPIEDEYGQILEKNVLEFLLKKVKEKEFHKITLDEDFNFIFKDKYDLEIFKFNAKTVRQQGILEKSQSKKTGIQEDLNTNLSGNLIKDHFKPIKPPQISEYKDSKRSFSTLNAIRLTKKAPKIIESKFRKKDLCSGYAISLLAQEYGVEKLEELGLIKRGKIPNAWDLKEKALKKEGIKITADVTDTLSQNKKSKKLYIKNNSKYIKGLTQFFEVADSKKVPSLITAFQTNTKWAKTIDEQNKKKAKEDKSNNSHVLVMLGREDQKTESFQVHKGRRDIQHFLWWKTKVNYNLQRYLNVTINRKNGDNIILEKDGTATINKANGTTETVTNPRNIKLTNGDTVNWQDVLISDFYKGKERVMGLAHYASKESVILMENYELQSTENKYENSEYTSLGYMQINQKELRKGITIRDQIQKKMDLTDKETDLYIAALIDAGLNLSKIRTKDLIPIFDIEEIRKIIKSKGGASKVMKDIKTANYIEHEKQDFRGFFIHISPNDEPWNLIKKHFEEAFKDRNSLTKSEKTMILEAVDASCPDIKITPKIEKFHSGTAFYITKMRIYKIKKYILEKQAKRFNKEDYVEMIEAGESSRAFTQKCFNKHSKTLKYEDLDAEEKELLSKAFQVSNPKTDPNKIRTGERLVFRKEELEKCLKQIIEKKEAEKIKEELLSKHYYRTKIIKGDRPERFIKECFNKENRKYTAEKWEGISKPANFKYSDLTGIEIRLLISALGKSNPNIDLTLIKKGDIEVRKKFRVGDVIKFDKTYLQQCIIEILKRREAQGIGNTTDLKQWSWTDKEYKSHKGIPEDLSGTISKIYPGDSVENMMTRNLLHLVYMNEQGRGWWEGTKEYFAPTFTMDSVGTMQIAPTEEDLIKCKSKFEKHGLKVPEDVAELKDILDDDDDDEFDSMYSIIVAGERLKKYTRSFRNYTKAAGDEFDLFDKNRLLLVLAAYNRSVNTIFWGIYQTWGIRLGMNAGVQVGYSYTDVDPLYDKKGKKEKMMFETRRAFKKIAEKLISTGEIEFTGNIDEELKIMFNNNAKFLRGPLFQALTKWNKEKTGSVLKLAPRDSELEYWGAIFSYGQRFMKKPGQWKNMFKDLKQAKSRYIAMKKGFKSPQSNGEKLLASASEKLETIERKMREQITPSSYLVENIEIESPEKDIAKKEMAAGQKLAKESGIEKYFRKENKLKLYASSLYVRQSPGGKKIGKINFGELMNTHGVIKRGKEYWIKISATNDPSRKGYVLFQSDWFNNKQGPELPSKIKRRFATIFQSNSYAKLPDDYAETMSDYLRFLHNYSPTGSEKTANKMANSKTTVFEVLDEVANEIIMSVAKAYGYKGEKFFAVLPKTGGANLKGQKLYVIDTENDRILSFKVSTGKHGTETRSGKYLAKDTGFKTVDALGKHRGSYAKKYKGHIVKNFTGGKEKTSWGKKVWASMTTTLMQVQRYGSDKKSEGVYFHGTNNEQMLGQKASSGCIRMANLDSVYLAGLLNGEKMNFQVVENSKQMNEAYAKGSTMPDVMYVQNEEVDERIATAEHNKALERLKYSKRFTKKKTLL